MCLERYCTSFESCFDVCVLNMYPFMLRLFAEPVSCWLHGNTLQTWNIETTDVERFSDIVFECTLADSPVAAKAIRCAVTPEPLFWWGSLIWLLLPPSFKQSKMSCHSVSSSTRNPSFKFFQKLPGVGKTMKLGMAQYRQGFVEIKTAPLSV